MATSGDGVAPYQGGGAGGKFRKIPIRRNAQGTPYDRPPTALRNNNPSLFAKLVDPASRLIYAGADRLFGVFRKRLPAIAAPRPPETSEEPRNGIQEAGPNIGTGVLEPSTDEGQNVSTISAATQISELENMLKQKTFTRSEIERLTALLHSRTTESPSDDVDEGGKAKHPSTTSQLLRLEASTSRPLNKHVEDREIFHASISTPLANSGAFEEDVASPAELAKAYMGTRPAKVSPLALRLGSQTPRQELVSLNNTTVLPRTPITSLAPRIGGSSKGLENGLTTPRSRGRSAMYNMARTPYYRGPSTLNQKGMKSDYGHGVASPSLELSQPVWEHDEPSGSSKMALKRRSSVLDDIGSGGPVRRIRQKASLLSQGSSLSKHKREFGSSALQQPGGASQKLLLRNEPEPKVSKTGDENGETSRRNLGYASVPTKSSQMASKILEQLDRLSPKEKPSGSRLAGTNEKSPTKQTSNMMHGQGFGSLEKVDSPKFLPSPPVNQKSEDQKRTWLLDARESTSQSKDKAEENGPKKFAVPRNVLSSMNGSSTVPVKDNAPIVANTDSLSKLPAEPPQKKRSFQMSAHEDSFEVDDDNRSNGHAFTPMGENKKLGTSLVANKDAPAEVNQTPALPEVCKTLQPEAGKTPAMPEFKKPDHAISPPKSDFGPPGGSLVKEQHKGFNFSTSTSSISNTQSAVFSQSTSIYDSVATQKEPIVLPKFGTGTKNAEKVPSFLFSANESSGSKTNASPDAKLPGSTSMFNSVTKNDQVQVPPSNKDDNVNSQKSVFMFGKSESLSPASSTMPSASGIFSFGGPAKNSSIANGASASSPSIFTSSSPFPASGTNTNKPFSSSSSHVPSSGTTTSLFSTTTNSANTMASSTPQPTPIFGFGSAIASTTSTLVAPTKDQEPKSNISSSPFASPSFATASTGSAFGFGSSAATNNTNGSQASAAVKQVVPFKFGSSSTTPASETTAIPSSSSSSGSSLFGSSAPAFSSAPSFGLSSAVASTEMKSGSPTSSSTTNVFGSSSSSSPSFGLSSAVASSETKFGSSWQPTKSSGFGGSFSSPSTGFSFGGSSASSSLAVFGSTSNAGPSTGSAMFSFTASGGTNSSFPAPSPGQSLFGNSTPVFGTPTASPNNTDQMSMEDSMAEDSTTQTPASSIPTFGQAPASSPGFMFGSATPTQSSVPFQFGGQTNQPPSQNPFQASGGQTNPPTSQNPFQASGGQPSQNPFQASGSVEFNAGGSFSLGSGGGDKSGRRIVRVKSKNRRGR